MKKVLFIIVCMIVITSCTDNKVKENVYVCDCEQQKAAAKFVSDNIQGANNMSDEEMEDVISQLEKTAVKLNCHRKRLLVMKSPDGYVIDVYGLKKGETSYEEY